MQNYYEYLTTIIAEASRKSLLCIKCLKTRLPEGWRKFCGSKLQLIGNGNLLGGRFAEVMRKFRGSHATTETRLAEGWRKVCGSKLQLIGNGNLLGGRVAEVMRKVGGSYSMNQMILLTKYKLKL